MNRDQHKAFGRTEADAMNDLRLGAARKRLAESQGQEDAIDAVREIVANFLGSEELGLFRVDRRSRAPKRERPIIRCDIVARRHWITCRARKTRG